MLLLFNIISSLSVFISALFGYVLILATPVVAATFGSILILYQALKTVFYEDNTHEEQKSFEEHKAA